MKGNNSVHRNFYIALALVPIILLSGCDWFKGKKGDVKDQMSIEQAKPGLAVKGDIPEGVLAVWSDGPMVTQKDLQEKLDAFMEQRPELKQMQAQFLPVLKSQILTALIYNKLIAKDIKDKGIDQTDEYKKMLNQVLENVKDRINAEFFAKQYEPIVTVSEKKEYYEKNKDRIPEFIIARGGVKSEGVTFTDKAQADAFANKAKAKGADFSKVAMIDKLTVEDFQFVNDQSRDIDRVLVENILKMKVPSVAVFEIEDKDGKKLFWVVKALEKQTTSYKPYKEVEGTIDAMLKQEKQGKELQDKLEALKVKYGVQIKEQAPPPPAPPMQPVPATNKASKVRKKVANAEDTQPLPVAKVA